jgi:hypothetical protein
VAGGSARRVLAGGEGLGGEEPVEHDPRDLLCLGVGDVLEEHGWRRWMAVAVTACSCSQRGAGEHGQTRRT